MPFTNPLRKITRAVNDATLAVSDAVHSDSGWSEWGAEHGWAYRGEDPGLAGVWFDDFSSQGMERFRHVLTSNLNGIDVIAFEHLRWKDEQNTSANVRGWLMVPLPGRPPAEAMDAGADKSLRYYGVHLGGNYEASFVGDQCIGVGRSGGQSLKHLHENAEQVTRVVASAPPGFFTSV
jgi:hypothetical protein